MTVAFLEPYDGDLARLEQQARNPKLLDALANEFRAHDFSAQHASRPS